MKDSYVMVNHRSVIGNPFFHLTIVDHVVIAATVVAALKLMSPVGWHLLMRPFAFVIRSA